MSGSGKSRLDKLLNLLEAGSTPAICKAAAQQIASTARTHPEHLPSLLRRIQPLLQHKRWETRTAAGKCIGYIAEHAKHATVAEVQAAVEASQAGGMVSPKDESGASSSEEPAEGMLSLATFDLERVLQVGTPLLASGGQEYDVIESPNISRSERLAKQRKHLKSRLGLGGPVDILDSADLIKDEDLVITSAPAPSLSSANSQQKDASAVISEMAGLSARERNKLKRDLKRKGSSMLQSQASLSQAKRGKTSADAPGQEQRAEEQAAAAEEAAAAWQGIVQGAWPFGAMCEQACLDVLAPDWETRHGAAVALREVLRSHAASAGVNMPLAPEPSGWMVPGGSGRPQLAPVTSASAAAAAAANQAWLEDCALRLVCALALDRFGDFVSDQVVAPVRETAAQALGAAARSLPPAKLAALARHLAVLVRRPEWEVRLGGLLGLKYLLAARLDAAALLLPEALPVALAGLKDSEDDVCAVSAEALLPVAHLLARQSGNVIDSLTSALWDALLEVDELNPSTGSVMQLLNQLQTGATAGQAKLTQRLWAFFRHPMVSVRLAAVRLFAKLVAFPAPKSVKQEECNSWQPDVLPPSLRLVFESLLQEGNADVLTATQDAWATLIQSAQAGSLEASISASLLQSWLQLAATPAGQPLDASLLLDTSNKFSSQKAGGGPRGAKRGANGHEPRRRRPAFGGGAEDGSGATVMRSEAAKAVGYLAAAWQPGCGLITEALVQQLGVPRAASRVLCALCTLRWALHNRQRDPPPLHLLPETLLQNLLALLAAPAATVTTAGLSVYEEAAPYYAQLRGNASALCSALSRAGYDVAQLWGGVPSEQALARMGTDAASVLAGVVTADVAAAQPAAASAAAALRDSIAAVSSVDALLHGSATALLAAAAVQAGHVPAKLNLVIQPLIGGLRREADPILRSAVADALAAFVSACIDRTPSPNDRIVKNLCAMACDDPGETPRASAPDPPPSDDAPASTASRENGSEAPCEDPALAARAVARQGAEAALRALATGFGAQLFQKLPRLWELASAAISLRPGIMQAPSADTQAVINTLQLLKVVGPALDARLDVLLAESMPSLASCCLHERRVVHAAAAACAEALAAGRPHCVLPHLLRSVVPMLQGSAPETARLGAVGMTKRLIAKLGVQMVPYINLLVVPLMGLSSDAQPPVRAAATAAFAAAVALLPLAQGIQPPEGLDQEQRAAWLHDTAFLSQLLDNSKVDEYVLPVEIRGELRSYQRAGISWLAFLRRCGLHGVLADDMGLGKTLQATAIVAACHVEQKRDGLPHKPSLIVCPPTLVGHWPHEIAKFIGNEALTTVQYEGTPPVRHALRERARAADVVVMSYEVLRADADWVSAHPWAYCVLDEGQIIRNPKSKISQAAKRVVAQHRLILSGTPIQNSVLELWALFDFLMPGFLGSHAAFQARYGRALAASRGSKAGSPEAQAGLLAMDGLHKQVMPFILRRTKDAVLKDLPPKILQDVYVEPSELQRRLYEDFSHSPASQQVASAVSIADASADARVEETAAKAPHVFQALQYLRKLCSHPLLVLDAAVPQHVAAVAAVAKIGADQWHQPGSQLRRLSHAPKLAALRELLQECGIIGDAEGMAAAKEEAVEGGDDAGHRVLVFAQLKSLLDIVERDVLQPAGISYLRLDGSVEAASRFGIVQRFNGDPSIPVMLLTTAVGGLGLNLTSADTVIFLEHDWNPMKDLQAMDRAHRLGQRRSVSVYRLLTRGTLEERIMGLQRFKLDVAHAVVNADNASLSSMDTAQVLDLFALQPSGGAGAGAKPAQATGVAAEAAAEVVGKAGKGLQAVLQGLGELWDEQQYAEELSLEAFMGKLKQ